MEENKSLEQDSLEKSSTIIEPSNNGDQNAQSASDGGDSSDSKDQKEPAIKNKSAAPKHPSIFKRIRGFSNLYFVIFVVLLLIAAGMAYAASKAAKKDNSVKQPKPQSLTDKQLAALKGSTTIVGDAQGVLDIQGNSVFEGQVLMRNNLDVAGSIKVGGTLSLPAITVGGSSSFGRIQVTDSLSVNGTTNLQGQLNVQKGLTVAGSATINGTLSAGVLNVTSLQLSGDLVINRHITAGGGTPTRVNGTALGGGGTASVNGGDSAGTVTINTGSSPPAGCFVTINFVRAFSSTPHIVISPSNSSAGALNYYANRTASNMSICTTSPPAASTTYVFDYIAIN